MKGEVTNKKSYGWDMGGLPRKMPRFLPGNSQVLASIEHLLYL